jgi:hypothetical protein
MQKHRIIKTRAQLSPALDPAATASDEVQPKQSGFPDSAKTIRYGWPMTVATVCVIVPPLLPAMSRLRLPVKADQKKEVQMSMLPVDKDQPVKLAEGALRAAYKLDAGPCSKSPLVSRLLQPTTNMHRSEPPPLSSSTADLLLVVIDFCAGTGVALASSYLVTNVDRSTYAVVVTPVGATMIMKQMVGVLKSAGTQDRVTKLTPGQLIVL